MRVVALDLLHIIVILIISVHHQVDDPGRRVREAERGRERKGWKAGSGEGSGAQNAAQDGRKP